MAGLPYWIKQTLHGQRCRGCTVALTEHAVKKLRFRPPRAERSVLKANDHSVAVGLYVRYPRCGRGQEFVARAITSADMQRGVDWLAHQSVRHEKPQADETPPNTTSAQHHDLDDICSPPKIRHPRGHGRHNERPSTSNPEVIPGTPFSARRSKKTKVHPSIRGICPPEPFTDESAAAAIRRLRAHSFKRGSPTFVRMMGSLG